MAVAPAQSVPLKEGFEEAKSLPNLYPYSPNLYP